MPCPPPANESPRASPRVRQGAAAAGLIALLAAGHGAAGVPVLRFALGALTAYLQLDWALREGGHERPWARLREAMGHRAVASELAWALGTAAALVPAWWLVAAALGFAVDPREFHTSAAAAASTFLPQLALTAVPEELFWRGTVQPAFCRRHDPPAGLAVPSALFALAHWAASGRAETLATFFPGLWFGLLARRRGRLLAACLCHAGCNTLSALCDAHGSLG